MKTLSRFVTKFTSLIVTVLSCFDRVLFKGHLALSAPCELEYFVDRVPNVRRTDFMKTLAPQYGPLGRACPELGAEGRPQLRVWHRPVPRLGRVLQIYDSYSITYPCSICVSSVAKNGRVTNA